MSDKAHATLGPPIPPCAGGPVPNYAEVGSHANIGVWRGENLPRWEPPSPCAGPAPRGTNTVVVTAARFRHLGDVDGLAARVADISSMTGIRYYSVHNRGWRSMLSDAYALDSFSADDLVPGRNLRFLHKENSPLSPITYRLIVRERRPDRLVYDIVNESPMRAFVLTATDAGAFRQHYVLERERGDVWRFYGLVQARTKTGMFSLSDKSFINRAAAYYRHVAGIPTDREPPPAQ